MVITTCSMHQIFSFLMAFPFFLQNVSSVHKRDGADKGNAGICILFGCELEERERADGKASIHVCSIVSVNSFESRPSLRSLPISAAMNALTIYFYIYMHVSILSLSIDSPIYLCAPTITSCTELYDLAPSHFRGGGSKNKRKVAGQSWCLWSGLGEWYH